MLKSYSSTSILNQLSSSISKVYRASPKYAVNSSIVFADKQIQDNLKTVENTNNLQSGEIKVCANITVTFEVQ